AGVEHRLQAIRVELVSIEKDRERLEEGRGRISAELEVCALEVSGVTGEDGEVTSELTELDERMASAAREVSTRRAGLVAGRTARPPKNARRSWERSTRACWSPCMPPTRSCPTTT